MFCVHLLNISASLLQIAFLLLFDMLRISSETSFLFSVNWSSNDGSVVMMMNSDVVNTFFIHAKTGTVACVQSLKYQFAGPGTLKKFGALL